MAKYKINENYEIILGKYNGWKCVVQKDPKGKITVKIDDELEFDPDDFFRMGLDAMRAVSLLEVNG